MSYVASSMRVNRIRSQWLLLIALLLLSLTSLGPQGFAGQELMLAKEAEAMQAEVADPEKHRILVLNSYNVGYSWTDNEIQAIQDFFAADPSVILQMEFMDTKLTNVPEHFANLRQLYAHKYRDAVFDVIIVTDDDALDFIRRFGDELFPGVPVVFAGINNFGSEQIAGMHAVTGVNEQADFTANLELILRLQPDVKDIYVITDELTAGRMIRREFEAAAAEFEGRLRFHFLNDLRLGEVRSKVATLGPNDAVFYLSFFQDASGTSFTPWEVIPLISSSSTAPLYGQVDYMLGKGILGGKVKASYYQGRVAAELAARIVDGELAECIPIVLESPNIYMFDYQQMQRFGIPLRALPADSIIINEPETFFYRYKGLIAVVGLAFTVLLIFIFVLLFNIRRRKRAQRGLQDILIAMSSVLELDSAAEIKEELIEIINRIIFLDRAVDQVRFYNYQGKLREYDASALIPLGADIAPSVPQPGDELIRSAIEQGTSIVRGRECVAVFKTQGLMGNIVYLEGDRRFEDIDQDLLEILTSNVSMAIETLEKSKMQEALETARKIQLSMLPQAFESVAEPFGVDVHAMLLPAKEVGGDLYDVFAVDEDHLCIAVGDVADKGVPAALFMAVAKTLIRAKAEPGSTPDSILSKVNNELLRDNEQCLFVTLFLAIYQRSTRTLHYANGGHNPPYLISADGVPTQLPLLPGAALGVIDDASYQPQQHQLAPGEALFAYTDGVTEAVNTAGDMYGEGRLQEVLARLGTEPAATIDRNLVDDIERFSRGAGQADDITVVTLRAQ
ncbi:ABC transporter substrate binding protein [Halochromatium sp.]